MNAVVAKPIPGNAITPEREAQVREVIELVNDGSSVRRACLKVGIRSDTFRINVLRLGMSAQYAEALATLAHAQVNQIEKTIGEMRAGKVDPRVGRTELENRRWLASKFLPKQYGDKTQLDVSGNLSIDSTDPTKIADALVARAQQFPAQAVLIREWAESILARIPKVLEVTP